MKKLTLEQHEFDVIREGKIVGEYKTSFDREDGKLVIKSHMMLKIYVLMFPASLMAIRD